MGQVQVREQAASVARKIADKGTEPLEWEWGFADGAVWAADRLPSRDEVAEELSNRREPEYQFVEEEDLTDADAVLALIRERIEGEA